VIGKQPLVTGCKNILTYTYTVGGGGGAVAFCVRHRTRFTFNVIKLAGRRPTIEIISTVSYTHSQTANASTLT